jgi:hypothetical protein
MKARSRNTLLGAAFLALFSGAVPAPQRPMGQVPDWSGCLKNPECKDSLLGLQTLAALQTQAILELQAKLQDLNARIGVLERGDHHGK